MSSYNTIQQHQPLRVPHSWGTAERRFVAQLEEVLDDIYRRFGRLRWEDLGKVLQHRFTSADGKISQLEQTAEQFEVRLSELGTPEELANAILRINHDGIFLLGGAVDMQTDNFAITSLADGEEMLHLDKQGLDVPLVSADVIRSPSVVSVHQGSTLAFSGGINASLANLPPYLTQTVSLYVPPGTYAEDIVISGLCGPGALLILPDDGVIVQGSISVVNCSCGVSWFNGTLLSTGAEALRASCSQQVSIHGLRIQGTGELADYGDGAWCDHGTLDLTNCVFERTHHCIRVGSGGHITAINNSGGAASSGVYTPVANSGYALYAEPGGTILTTGTAPTGMQGTANVQLNTPGVASIFGDTSSASSDGTVISPVNTLTLQSVECGRLRIATDKSTSAFTSSAPFQGRSFGYDNWGAWFFGDQLAEVRGKRIKAARLTVTRATAWGSESAAAVNLYTHSWSSRPTATFSRTTLDNTFSASFASVQLARGEAVVIDLPSTVLRGLENGSVCGFAVARQGSYTQMEGACTLTIELESEST